MSYSVKQLSKIAKISVRALHHYDEIGLLKPARVKENGYRQYEEKELLKLQQILFFREIGFPLKEIIKIISSANFDTVNALKEQKNLIKLKRERLSGLIKTIDRTINKINKKNIMKDEELYKDFGTEELDKYTKEAKERWGHTSAYKQSEEKIKKMSKADLDKIKTDGEILTQKIASSMSTGFDSTDIQQLISKHYDALRNFYEPTLEIYSGLADMYISDPRFSAYYENYAKGLAQFMHDAMIYFVRQNKNNLNGK